jgi:integrase
MKRTDEGRGTIRTIRDRKTGEVLGYQALLPREQSRAPEGVKNPQLYQEPVGPRCSSAGEARSLLDAVLVELRDRNALKHGLTFASYIAAELRARRQDARRRYATDARANRAIATWKSIDKRWLSDAPFYALPPAVIAVDDLQRYVDWLRDEAEGVSGEPLSPNFIRNVGSFMRAAFERVGGTNPAKALRLPPKGEPQVRFIDIVAQRLLFGADDEKVDIADRVMVGCGMGAGLRVGELLAFEPRDVHLDDHDPYLWVQFGGADHAPTKGKRARRVELFEPGLGFWRKWMREFYAGGDRVFAGPAGGYRKHWPESFPGWAAVAGVERLSSHVMRHTYAVALLSGTWGYDPRSIEFVSQQLGHKDIQTTERFYKAFEKGTWVREARRMTGRADESSRRIVTASELLGLDASSDASGGGNDGISRGNAIVGLSPRHSPKSPQSNEEIGSFDALTHHSREALEAAFREVQAGAPTGIAQLVNAARRILLSDADRLAALKADPEADVG